VKREFEWTRQVESTIEEQGLFARGDRIVVGVSGGPDSVALLHLLCAMSGEHDWFIAAAHVNHGLRGEESDAEEDYVRTLSEQLGVRCFVIRVDVKGHLPEFGGNVQAAARELRFRALSETAATWGTSIVTLGHHGDDQAETVLMRLLRGTSPGGLSGIRPISYVFGLKLVRPLLRIPKSELETYCEHYGLKPRIDSSNESRNYFRNAIRLDILPYIMKLRDGAADALRRLADMSADEDDYLDGIAREQLASIVPPQGDGNVTVPRERITRVHIALQRRMIKIILNSLKMDEDAIDYAKIERIREAITAERPTTLALTIGDDVVFRRSYDTLEWGYTGTQELLSQPYSFQIPIERQGTLALDAIGASLEWTFMSGVQRLSKDAEADDPYTAWFDADALHEHVPLVVRTRNPGDRMAVFGLNGSKKVKDMFIDAKLPKHHRGLWPILTDGAGQVLWVPGFRRSRAALLHADTKAALVIKLKFTGNILR
jgi:tRNA(Ile)-lysidine synthase